MRSFELLILAHLVGDYLVQTEFEAMNKALGPFWNRALWAHCSKYAACFIPVLALAGLSQWWLALIFFSHLFFDRRWPIIWWRRVVTHNSAESIKATFWLTVVVDQIFHTLVLALIVIVSASS